MTKTQIELVIKYLDECCHDFAGWYNHPTLYICQNCNKNSAQVKPNRTFTADADFFAVRNKLVEKGDWQEFKRHAVSQWFISSSLDDFELWITSKTKSGTYRLCELLGEWLEERRTK